MRSEVVETTGDSVTNRRMPELSARGFQGPGRQVVNDGSRRSRAIERVKMDARDTVREQVTALMGGPRHADFFDVRRRGRGVDVPQQTSGETSVRSQLRHALHALDARDRHDAGDDGDMDFG